MVLTCNIKLCPHVYLGRYIGEVLDAAGLAAKYPGSEGSDYLLKVSADRWIDAASGTISSTFTVIL